MYQIQNGGLWSLETHLEKKLATGLSRLRDEFCIFELRDVYTQVAGELRKRGILAAHYHADMNPETRSSVHTRCKIQHFLEFCEAKVCR